MTAVVPSSAVAGGGIGWAGLTTLASLRLLSRASSLLAGQSAKIYKIISKSLYPFPHPHLDVGGAGLAELNTCGLLPPKYFNTSGPDI
jgi:hypothetical protein